MTVSPHRTITNQVSQTFELPGGGPRFSPPGVWTECKQRTIEKDIQIQECPHDDDLVIQPRVETIRRTDHDFDRRPRIQTIRGTKDEKPAKRIVSPFTPHMPVPPSDRPQWGPWQVAVVRVEETPVEDATKLKTPNTTADRRRPIDLSEVEENDSPELLAAPPPPPSRYEEM